MKILTSVCLLFIVGFCTSSSRAQDIHYTMFDMAPLELNPVYTGYFAGTFRVGGIYRTQWSGLSVSVPPSRTNGSTNFSGFQTPSAYIDIPFGIPPKDDSKSMKSWAGVGVSFYYDVVGTQQMGQYSNLAASISLAYHLGLGEKGKTILSFGVQGGILQRRITGDYTFEEELTGDLRVDPLYGYSGGNASRTVPDFSGGIMLSHRGEKFGIEAAVSLNHFTTPDISLAESANLPFKLPMTGIANIAMRIALSKRFMLRPLAFYQTTINTGDQGELLSAFDLNGQLLLGIHFNDDQDITFYIGGGYRASGDAIARIGLDVKGLKFGFAYDINTQAANGLSYRTFSNNNTGMAFEVALSYVAKLYREPIVEDILFCPRF